MSIVTQNILIDIQTRLATLEQKLATMRGQAEALVPSYIIANPDGTTGALFNAGVTIIQSMGPSPYQQLPGVYPLTGMSGSINVKNNGSYVLTITQLNGYYTSVAGTGIYMDTYVAFDGQGPAMTSRTNLPNQGPSIRTAGAMGAYLWGPTTPGPHSLQMYAFDENVVAQWDPGSQAILIALEIG